MNAAAVAESSPRCSGVSAEHAFHELQAEWQRLLDQLGIVVGSIGRAGSGERIGEAIRREALDRTAGSKCRDDEHHGAGSDSPVAGHRRPIIHRGHWPEKPAKLVEISRIAVDVVVPRAFEHDDARLPGPQLRDERVRPRARNDLVRARDHDQRVRLDRGRTARRVVAIAHQQADREIREVRASDIHETVEWRDEYEALDFALARELDGDAAAEAAADDRDLRVARTQVVVQRDRIADQAALGRLSGAAAVPAVVHQVDRVLRKARAERWDIESHVLAIAAEVEDGRGARPCDGPDLEFRSIDREAHRSCARRIRLPHGKVDL